ncbi:MAG: hypothetical protein ACI9J0_004665, partial [Cryomorphaceae bacterium]
MINNLKSIHCLIAALACTVVLGATACSNNAGQDKVEQHAAATGDKITDPQLL